MSSQILQYSYLDPDEVFTTVPLAAPLGTGEVVTASPSAKFDDPVIFPVMDPSGFCFQLLIVGTPGGALEPAGTGTVGDESSSLDPNPNRLPREMVERFVRVLDVSSDFSAACCRFTFSAAACLASFAFWFLSS